MADKLPRLVGITGKAGSGKDTLADHLVAAHGYTKYSLAEPIKKLLNERFGWTDENWLDREWKEDATETMYHDREDDLQYFSPRSWAQWLGTEVGRYIGGEDVWVNMMENVWLNANEDFERACLSEDRQGGSERYPIAPCMVIPDVRFDNEAKRIRSLGGVVIRVVRPNAKPVTAHSSEQSISDALVDTQVVNDAEISTYLNEAINALSTCPRSA